MAIVVVGDVIFIEGFLEFWNQMLIDLNVGINYQIFVVEIMVVLEGKVVIFWVKIGYIGFDLFGIVGNVILFWFDGIFYGEGFVFYQGLGGLVIVFIVGFYDCQIEFGFLF